MSDDPVVQVTIDGETVDVDPLDIDGNEWATIKKQTGLKPAQVMADVQDMDFEALAALLFVVKRREDPSVQYDEILSGLSMRSLIGDDDEDEVEDAEASPSGSGADSEG